MRRTLVAMMSSLALCSIGPTFAGHGSPRQIDCAQIKFGPMATTMRACFGPLAELETKYLAAPDAVRSWRVKGAKLKLLQASGAPLVTLTRAR